MSLPVRVVAVALAATGALAAPAVADPDPPCQVHVAHVELHDGKPVVVVGPFTYVC